MGYIAPVNNEPVTQYVNRSLPQKRKPLKAFPIAKLTIGAKLKGRTQSFDHKQPYQLHFTKKNLPAYNSNEIMISEITGKGRYINEYR